MFGFGVFLSRDYPVKLVYKRPHIVLSPDKEVSYLL